MWWLVLLVCASCAAQVCVPPLSELQALGYGKLNCSYGAVCSIAADGKCHVTQLTQRWSVMDNALPTSIALPYLTEALSSIDLNGNANIEWIAFERLANVKGHFQAESNGKMRSFWAPLLNHTDGFLSFYGNKILESITLPSLTSTGDDILIRRTPSLLSVSFPKLTGVGGALQISLVDSLMFVGVPLLRATCTRSWDEKNTLDNGPLYEMCPQLVSYKPHCPALNPTKFYCPSGNTSVNIVKH